MSATTDTFARFVDVLAEVSELSSLSSDAGDYLFPSSVECVRLLHETLRCYGLTDEEIQICGSKNGSYILGVDNPA